MRGARIQSIPTGICGGIIPADAGSTIRCYAVPGNDRDHPRGCGEHRRKTNEYSENIGSSPRMRGAQTSGKFCRGSSRIIPADAGSTITSSLVNSTGWDHPRGCGEHSVALSHLAHHPGSSPRMRGAHWCICHGIPLDRIIPADAGSTVTNTPSTRVSRDHPRGCGEHINDTHQPLCT